MARGKRQIGTVAAPQATMSVPLSSVRGRLSPAEVAKRLAAEGAIRKTQTVFEKDREIWKKKEKEFVSNAAKRLQKLINQYAESDEGWRQLIQIYARAPHYSILNMLWAWAQLEHKGVRADGMIFSESAWKSLGRRVKPEYRRSWKPEVAWNDKYIAGMLGPIIVRAKDKESENKAAEKTPTLAQAVGGMNSSKLKNGEKGQFVQPTSPYPNFSNRVIGFKIFDVYHEDATEPIGEEKDLPRPSWFMASGTPEAAEKLWQDVESIAAWQGLKLELTPSAPTGLSQAHYSRAGKIVKVSESSNLADQASAALGALIEHFEPKEPAKNDNEVKMRVVARESAKFALTSLYGLESDKQAFTFLADIAEDEKMLKHVLGDVHSRVVAITNHLDPVLQQKIRGQEDANKEYQGRAKKRQGQKRKGRRVSPLAK